MKVIIVIGVIVIVIVGGYFAVRAAVRAQCDKVKRAYASDAEAAAKLYGHPSFNAWLAAQNAIVRWFC